MRSWIVLLTVSWSLAAGLGPMAAGDDPPADPLSAQSGAARNNRLDEIIAGLTGRIENESENVDLFSQRGDALFFRARFDEAVADYERMLELKPELEALHWRRGLAYYYVGRYDEAARQFEMYYAQDDVDRENGIWRYYSHVKSRGPAAARQALLKYDKPDRSPLGDVYRLCEGTITIDEMLSAIQSAPLDAPERDKQLFYAHLYAGLHDAVHGESSSAREHLQIAVRNTWPHTHGGYGPRYMWQVGRLQLDLLPAEQPAEPRKD